MFSFLMAARWLNFFIVTPVTFQAVDCLELLNLAGLITYERLDLETYL
jgi:hypothetical protein